MFAAVKAFRRYRCRVTAAIFGKGRDSGGGGAQGPGRRGGTGVPGERRGGGGPGGRRGRGVGVSERSGGEGVMRGSGGVDSAYSKPCVLPAGAGLPGAFQRAP